MTLNLGNNICFIQNVCIYMCTQELFNKRPFTGSLIYEVYYIIKMNLF